MEVWAMKRFFFLAVFFVAFVGSTAYAAGLEMAVGVWQQSPSGDLSYKSTGGNDVLDLQDDLNYESENRFMGRLKIDSPFFFPNIYLVAAPMEFEGTGRKSTQFTFGDQTFRANAAIDSKVTFNQYDIALYWGIPVLHTVTAGRFTIDLGINARLIDFSAEVTGESASAPGDTVHEEKGLSLLIPMAYVAFQIAPTDRVAIEAEARGISVGGNSLYSFIGRLRIQAFGPAFIAGGYRIDSLDVDEDDLKANMDFSGPFVELGLKL
jgi:outer membrane protein